MFKVSQFVEVYFTDYEYQPALLIKRIHNGLFQALMLNNDKIYEVPENRMRFAKNHNFWDGLENEWNAAKENCNGGIHLTSGDVVMVENNNELKYAQIESICDKSYIRVRFFRTRELGTYAINRLELPTVIRSQVRVYVDFRDRKLYWISVADTTGMGDYQHSIFRRVSDVIFTTLDPEQVGWFPFSLYTWADML